MGMDEDTDTVDGIDVIDGSLVALLDDRCVDGAVLGFSILVER